MYLQIAIHVDALGLGRLGAGESHRLCVEEIWGLGLGFADLVCVDLGFRVVRFLGPYTGAAESLNLSGT